MEATKLQTLQACGQPQFTYLIGAMCPQSSNMKVANEVVSVD